jgi:hypothetical protein
MAFPKRTRSRDDPRDDRVEYVLDAVADPERQRLLETLSGLSEKWISVDGLIRRTRDCADGRADERFATAVRYVHLPMLANLGVVDYRPDEDRVAHRRARVADVLVTAVRAFAARENASQETVLAASRTDAHRRPTGIGPRSRGPSWEPTGAEPEGR